ncbi:MAG: hypothetical protein E6I60_09315, partial [Chloroflexi bacterium]
MPKWTLTGPALIGVVVAALLPLAQPLPSMAASSASPVRAIHADPAIGPHAGDEAAHAQDRVRLTPAHSPIVARRVPSAAAGALGLAAPAANSTLTREVLGFAPYYELSQRANWNYALLSTVAYFGLNVNADGSFNTS